MGLISYIQKKKEESFLRWILAEANRLMPATSTTIVLNNKKKIRITRTIRGVVKYVIHKYEKRTGDTKPYWHYTVYEYNCATKEVKEIRSGKYNFDT